MKIKKRITYKPITDMSVLKVGDIVYIDTTHDLRRHGTAMIMRFTKTMIVCNDPWGNKIRFRYDGTEITSDPWHNPHIIGIVIKEELLEEVK